MRYSKQGGTGPTVKLEGNLRSCGGNVYDTPGVGSRLMRLLTAKRMSQSELARRSGVSRVHINQLLKGKRRVVTLETATALAHGLGVRPEIFLATEDSEWLFMSTYVFEGVLRELRNGYGFGSKPGDE